MKKVLKVLSNIILCILLFIITLFLLILIPVRHTINKNNVKDIISNVNIEQTLNENKEYENIVNEMLEPILEETRKIGISDEVIIKILDSKEVKNLLGDVAGNFMDAIITGNSQGLLSNEDVKELVSDVIDDINNLQLYEIDTSEKEKILDFVDEQVNEYIEFMPTTDMITSELSYEEFQDLKMVQFILSDELLIYTAIILGIVILCIGLINYSQGKFVKIILIPMLVASFLMTLLSWLVSGYFKAMYAKDSMFFYDIIHKSMKFSTKLSGWITIIILTIFIIGIIIINSKRLKKQSNEN